MFLQAGFNACGKTVLWAYVRIGDGAPRWTRLYRFECGDLAWIGKRLGWASFGCDATHTIKQLRDVALSARPRMNTNEPICCRLSDRRESFWGI
jgi:hypothetical protein